MSLNPPITTLRQRLWDITIGPDRAPVSEWAQRFSGLRSEFLHTIKVLPNPYGTAIPLEHFTCFLHVLGLAQCLEYIKIAARYSDLFAGTDFMLFLIREGTLRQIVREDPSDGDIIVYFESDQPKHAGFVFQGRIRSKWGTGLFVEHDIWEVPTSYGHEYRYFTPLNTEAALEAFLSFAGSKLTSTAPPTSS